MMAYLRLVILLLLSSFYFQFLQAQRCGYDYLMSLGVQITESNKPVDCRNYRLTLLDSNLNPYHYHEGSTVTSIARQTKDSLGRYNVCFWENAIANDKKNPDEGNPVKLKMAGNGFVLFVPLFISYLPEDREFPRLYVLVEHLKRNTPNVYFSISLREAIFLCGSHVLSDGSLTDYQLNGEPFHLKAVELDTCQLYHGSFPKIEIKRPPISRGDRPLIVKNRPSPVAMKVPLSERSLVVMNQNHHRLGWVKACPNAQTLPWEKRDTFWVYNGSDEIFHITKVINASGPARWEYPSKILPKCSAIIVAVISITPFQNLFMSDDAAFHGTAFESLNSSVGLPIEPLPNTQKFLVLLTSILKLPPNIQLKSVDSVDNERYPYHSVVEKLTLPGTLPNCYYEYQFVDHQLTSLGQWCLDPSKNDSFKIFHWYTHNGPKYESSLLGLSISDAHNHWLPNAKVWGLQNGQIIPLLRLTDSLTVKRFRTNHCYWLPAAIDSVVVENDTLRNYYFGILKGQGEFSQIRLRLLAPSMPFVNYKFRGLSQRQYHINSKRWLIHCFQEQLPQAKKVLIDRIIADFPKVVVLEGEDMKRSRYGKFHREGASMAPYLFEVSVEGLNEKEISQFKKWLIKSESIQWISIAAVVQLDKNDSLWKFNHNSFLNPIPLIEFKPTVSNDIIALMAQKYHCNYNEYQTLGGPSKFGYFRSSSKWVGEEFLLAMSDLAADSRVFSNVNWLFIPAHYPLIEETYNQGH